MTLTLISQSTNPITEIIKSHKKPKRHERHLSTGKIIMVGSGPETQGFISSGGNDKVGEALDKWHKESNVKTPFQKTALQFRMAGFAFSEMFQNKSLKDISTAEVFINGKEYKSQEFTSEEKKHLEKILGDLKRYKIKACFQNAQNLAINYPELKYVEGYVNALIPIIHAWVTYNGKVVDVTLRKDYKGSQTDWDNRNIGKLDREYYGVEIPREEVSKCMLSLKTYSSVLEDYRTRQMIDAIKGKQK